MSDWDVRRQMEAALAEYDFERAATLARSGADREMAGLLQERREQAEAEARALHLLVTGLARDHDYRTLFELAQDKATTSLMKLLPDDTRKRSAVHLNGAERWAARQAETNRRRMAEARKALDAMDLDFASAVLARLDADFIDEPMASERNELLLAITARSIEIEELTASAAETIRELRPPKRSWWRRRRK